LFCIQFLCIIVYHTALIISIAETYTFLSYLTIPGLIIAYLAIVGIVIHCYKLVLTNEISPGNFNTSIRSSAGYIGAAMYMFDSNM